MNFLEGLRIALWSLLVNPLRSFLTLLGIIIGVTAIIAVVAVINGLNLYYEIHGTGRPLILLHGGLMSNETFGPVLHTACDKKRFNLFFKK